MLLCDIDQFKSVNDQHGHRAGDLVLTEVARVLARHGVAGRLGGDEFGIWVREGRRPAGAACQAIPDDVAASLPPELVLGGVGITVGMAQTPAGGADVMELIEAADRELYAGKPGGRRRD